MLTFLPASRPARGALASARWLASSLAAHAGLVGVAVGPALWGMHQAADGAQGPVFQAALPQAALGNSDRITYIPLAPATADQAPRGTRPAAQPPAKQEGERSVGSPGADVPPLGEASDAVRAPTEVDQVASRAPDAVNPPYPAELAGRGVEGHADFQFVVDTSGYVELASVTAIGATHQPFADAVVTVMPRMRFTPAVMGGRPVRQLVSQRFIFRLLRADSAAARP